MTDDHQSRPGGPGASSPKRRSGSRLPWADPNAPSAWWSAPGRAQRGRIVDQAPPPPGTPNAANGMPNTPDDDPSHQNQDDLPDSFSGMVARAREFATSEEGINFLRTAATRVALAVLLVAAIAIIIPHVGDLTKLVANRPATPTAILPTPTHAPTATPTTPKQTELDGVITITNLDAQVPFEGNVQVLAHNGAWYCRNSPMPHSTWHIRLDGGETISLPCVIPVATPSSLPPHTFRQAVSSTDGTGLALVDNPEAFLGTAFVPTAVPTP